MIDNLHQIKSLLNFEKEGDFYMLYILKRKKDQTTDKSNHQSVRTIKTYCVESVEYLEKRYEEIKELCEMFKARAYIHVQKQSHHDVSLNMLVALAERIGNGQHRQQHLFDSVVGQLKTLENDGLSISMEFQLMDLPMFLSTKKCVVTSVNCRMKLERKLR
jgi:hypothetical protein